MKHISIILPMGSSIVDTIIAPYNLLKMANAYQMSINGNKEPRYKIDLVGLSLEPVTYQGLFTVTPTATIDSIKKTDIIIVSPISGDMDKGIVKNRKFVEWMKMQRIENYAQLASLCKGAFLLAETGLLNGKSCSTHWTAHNQFEQKYPSVNLVPEKIICEDNGIYSSGGAYSVLNFIVYLIERFYDRETAIYCSKLSEIEFDRVSQNEFIIFSGQKEHSDAEILKAQNYIEENYDQKCSVEELSTMTNMNKRSFLRRFKKATSNTPIEYIQRVKVEAAKRMLESTAKNIFEVMYSIGYNDEKAFRNTFRKYSGLSPKDYQKKFNREMAVS